MSHVATHYLGVTLPRSTASHTRAKVTSRFARLLPRCALLVLLVIGWLLRVVPTWLLRLVAVCFTTCLLPV